MIIPDEEYRTTSTARDCFYNAHLILIYFLFIQEGTTYSGAVEPQSSAPAPLALFRAFVFLGECFKYAMVKEPEEHRLIAEIYSLLKELAYYLYFAPKLCNLLPARRKY